MTNVRYCVKLDGVGLDRSLIVGPFTEGNANRYADLIMRLYRTGVYTQARTTVLDIVSFTDQELDELETSVEIVEGMRNTWSTTPS